MATALGHEIMFKNKAVIVDYDVVTAFGYGVKNFMSNLMLGNSAIRQIQRFNTDKFLSQNGAECPGISPNSETTSFMQLYSKLLTEKEINIPVDSDIIIATTTGEIELLEHAVISGNDSYQTSSLQNLIPKLKQKFKISGDGEIISSACASSSIAVAKASYLIASGKSDSVLVTAADSLSEFVFSGFSSLMAISPICARPFDKNRNGISIGEGAGYMLFMSQKRAIKENRTVIAEVLGWGSSSDAFHLTAPDEKGIGLISAIKKTLLKANMTLSEVSAISAHGTGTLFNDAMEISALTSLFNEYKVKKPIYGIKGACGHTMGFAGLLESIAAIETLQNSVIPPTVNLLAPEETIADVISNNPVRIEGRNKCILTLNSGFGGINSALLFAKSCY